MVRNARFGGANNRFLSSDVKVCKKVKRLNELLPDLNPPFVPQFALRKSLEKKRPLPEDIIGVYTPKGAAFEKGNFGLIKWIMNQALIIINGIIMEARRYWVEW
jgi:hypothetical protein